MNKAKLIETIRSVPISGKTYEEYVEALAERIVDGGWISVEEMLPDPKKYDWVLVAVMFNEDGSYGVPQVAECRGGRWYDGAFYLDELRETVTHWMPLPGYPERRKYEQRKAD